mgnify:CR=1
MDLKKIIDGGLLLKTLKTIIAALNFKWLYVKIIYNVYFVSIFISSFKDLFILKKFFLDILEPWLFLKFKNINIQNH